MPISNPPLPVVTTETVSRHCPSVPWRRGEPKTKKTLLTENLRVQLCDSRCDLWVAVFRANRLMVDRLHLWPHLLCHPSLSSCPTGLILAASWICYSHSDLRVFALDVPSYALIPDICMAYPLSFKSLFKCHLLNEPHLNWPPDTSDLPTLLFHGFHST